MPYTGRWPAPALRHRGCLPAVANSPPAALPPGPTEPSPGRAASLPRLALLLLPALIAPYPRRNRISLLPDALARAPGLLFKLGQFVITHEFSTSFHIGPGHAALNLLPIGRHSAVQRHVTNIPLVTVTFETHNGKGFARDQG